jgi:hypothetical protein
MNAIPPGKYVVIIEQLDFKNPPYQIVDCKCVTRENALCRSNYTLPYNTNYTNYTDVWALRVNNGIKVIYSPFDTEKMITIIKYDEKFKYDDTSCFVFESLESFCVLWGIKSHFELMTLSRKCILSGSRI